MISFGTITSGLTNRKPVIIAVGLGIVGFIILKKKGIL